MEMFIRNKKTVEYERERICICKSNRSCTVVIILYVTKPIVVSVSTHM